jgi:hypothetical protein
LEVGIRETFILCVTRVPTFNCWVENGGPKIYTIHTREFSFFFLVILSVSKNKDAPKSKG